MSRWRRKAVELLLGSANHDRRSKIQRVISASTNPHELWMDVELEFQDAHDDPPDEPFIAGVYDYAKWCVTQPEDRGLLSATVVSFWEDLPLDKRVVHNLVRW